MKNEKLHSHPNLERKLGLDENHVIIDKDTFFRLLKAETKNIPKIAEEFEHKFVHKYILSSDGWSWKNKDMHYNEIIEFINTKLREVSN